MRGQVFAENLFLLKFGQRGQKTTFYIVFLEKILFEFLKTV